MIIQAERLLAKSAGCNSLVAHVFEGEQNEEVVVLRGGREDVADMFADAMAARRKFGVRHFKVSPREATSRGEALQMVDALAREFAFDASRCTIIEHAKRRARGPNGQAHGRHWHVLVPEYDPVADRVLDSSWMRARHEKVARVTEIRLGHGLVTGRWGAAVERALLAEGRDDLAAQVAATARSPRPTSSFTVGQHQRAAREGLSIAQARAVVALAWASADGDAARLAALRDAGVSIQQGRKAGVWTVSVGGQDLGALDRFLREARKQTGLSAEAWRATVDEAMQQAHQLQPSAPDASVSAAGRRSRAADRRAERLLAGAKPARLAALAGQAAEARDLANTALQPPVAATVPAAVDERKRRRAMRRAERSLLRADPEQLARLAVEAAAARQAAEAAPALPVPLPSAPAGAEPTATTPVKAGRLSTRRAERQLAAIEPDRLAALAEEAAKARGLADAARTLPASAEAAPEAMGERQRRRAMRRAERALLRADSQRLARLATEAAMARQAAEAARTAPADSPEERINRLLEKLRAPSAGPDARHQASRRAERAILRADPGRLSSLVADAVDTHRLASAPRTLTAGPMAPAAARETQSPALLLAEIRLRAGLSHPTRAARLAALFNDAKDAADAARSVTRPGRSGPDQRRGAPSPVWDAGAMGVGNTLGGAGGTAAVAGGFKPHSANGRGRGSPSVTVGRAGAGGGEPDRHDAPPPRRDVGHPEGAHRDWAAAPRGDRRPGAQTLRTRGALATSGRCGAVERLRGLARDLRGAADRQLRDPLAARAAWVGVAVVRSAAPTGGRQTYKVSLIAGFYETQIDSAVAGELAWVRSAAGHVEAVLHDGTCIRDTGAVIEASDMTDAAARTMMAMAAAHGWTQIVIDGGEEAKAAMWLAAQRRGLEVTNWRPPAAVWEAWEREEAARKRAADVAALAGRPRLSLANVISTTAAAQGSRNALETKPAPADAGRHTRQEQSERTAGPVDQPRRSPTPDARAVELLGQARAEELVRRRQGPVSRQIAAMPGPEASEAERSSWLATMSRQATDARERLRRATGEAPLRSAADARRSLMAEPEAALQQAKRDARAAARAVAEHQAERPSALTRWFNLGGAGEMWRSNAEALASQYAAASAELDGATTLRREREQYLASPEGAAEIQAVLDRSRLAAELSQLRQRDLSIELQELERRVQRAQRDWEQLPASEPGETSSP